MKNWLDKSEYPFKSNFLEINNTRLHYIDEGVGEILLFVHGTPSWSFDFRHIIKSLNSEYRCIAIDHIGFGLSNKPEHYDYSTQNHSLSLEKFVLSLGLNNITLIVHDFGGPIGLNFAIRHPELIKQFVILNSWLWSSIIEPEFKSLKRMINSPVLPFLYRYFNFSARFILPSSFGKKKINKHLLKQYTSPFAKSSQRNGTIAFAKSLINDHDWFEELWTKKHNISSKRTLFIWGMQDKFILPTQLAKFASAFENSSQLRLDNCGHFPQEEEPESVIKEMRTFLLGGTGVIS